MKKISSLAGLTIAILSLCWCVPAQDANTKALKPVPDDASLQETGKWLIKALKKSFAFPANDNSDSYHIEDLSFKDCLLSFNVAQEFATGSNRSVGIGDDGDTPSNGNRTVQVKIGTKVRDEIDPNTRQPRIDPGTDPDHFPARQSVPRTPKRPERKIVDAQMFDLYQVDTASFRVTKSRTPGISYLSMANRSLTAKGPEEIGSATGGTIPEATPSGPVISQKSHGTVSLNENSTALIRAGFERAISLCQAPK